MKDKKVAAQRSQAEVNISDAQANLVLLWSICTELVLRTESIKGVEEQGRASERGTALEVSPDFKANFQFLPVSNTLSTERSETTHLE
jgi:hypothetical protein